VDEDGIDAEPGAGGEGLSGELEEDSFVHVRLKYRMGEAWNRQQPVSRAARFQLFGLEPGTGDGGGDRGFLRCAAE
jgi:hypothetical protein